MRTRSDFTKLTSPVLSPLSVIIECISNATQMRLGHDLQSKDPVPGMKGRTRIGSLLAQDGHKRVSSMRCRSFVQDCNVLKGVAGTVTKLLE